MTTGLGADRSELATRLITLRVVDPRAQGFAEEVRRQAEILAAAEEEEAVLAFLDAAAADIEAEIRGAEDQA